MRPPIRKNAGHPPARKTSECRKKKAPTFPSSETSARTLALSISHTERAPAAVGPPPCKSPASRHRAFAPRLPPTFSGLASQWLTFVTQLPLFRCILAPTVPFAWGFCAPFLSKLPPDRVRSLRRQPHSILGPLFTYPGRSTHYSALYPARSPLSRGRAAQTVIFLHFPPPIAAHSPRTAGWTRTAPPCPSRRCRYCGRTAPARGTPPPGTGCGAPSAPAAG